jgi:mycofactocin biosynthetic radical S-adenosylmethionine protein MftC
MSAEPGSFGALVQRVWRENRLFSVLLELTYRCNLDCWFCYNDLSVGGRPLSTSEWLGLLDDLRRMQVLNVTFSGGEPLAHPDFLRLGRRARDLGFVVRVKSNGHSLGPEVARRLKAEVDPFVIEVSLHGARAKTHDRQTRVAGSFDRLQANVLGMKAAGLRVQMNATLTIWNEGEIEAMFAMADDLGVVLQIDPEVTARDDGDRSTLAITASREGVLRLFEIQAARAGDGMPVASRDADRSLGPIAPGKHCGAGSSGIAVDPYGNVYPCVQWRHPVGNLHEASLPDIWRTSRELDAVRRVSGEVKRMVEGQEDGALMSFCPGNAAALTGSPLRLYPQASRRAALAREAKSRRTALRVLPE